MTRRRLLFFLFMLVLSVALLTVFHFVGEPAWLKENLPPADGAAGILWQVQSTFLSVGFAGLAIAAQLFAEAPLAIGASRGKVLEFIRLDWFVGVGLTANAVIAVATIWLPSSIGVIIIALCWFTPTVVLLIVSTVRLMQLFGRPSQLDEVVRKSLVDTLSTRLKAVSSEYADARKQLDALNTSAPSVGSLRTSTFTLRVSVTQDGRVIKAIKPKILKQAFAILGPRATEDGASDSVNAVAFTPPQIALVVEPGDRTLLGETAFRVSTSQKLDENEQSRLTRLLQSSIEYEPFGTVTRYEETAREIAILEDAVGTNLRSGAFSTAERAMELLGHVIRGVWTAEPDSMDSPRRASSARRDWLFRTIGRAEQDALLSPRAADLFVSAAMTRALEAPRTGSTGYVDECLRSFTWIWNGVVQHAGPEFDHLPNRIVTCVQNLAAYSYPTADQQKNLTAHATWTMVELVKLAVDAKRPDVAKLAAAELNGLFRHSAPSGTDRVHVRAGQLVLSGWLDYLADKGDSRHPADSRLQALVTPDGTRSEILAARAMTARGVAPFTRWDWWETQYSLSGEAQFIELPHYIDRAEVGALASSYGPLPPANDDEVASEYKRFLRLLDTDGSELSLKETMLKERLTEEVGKWDAAEDRRLAEEPLSKDRLDELLTALRETLDTGYRLAAELPVETDIPDSADKAKPILGVNFHVPRQYLVDEAIHQTIADPKELGQIIARGFAEGEEERIVDILRSLQKQLIAPSTNAILDRIKSLDDEAKHYVLLTPYGGLADPEWYSVAIRDVLSRVTHIETALLDEEAILFDRRATLLTARMPEAKEGLSPVGGTSIALGVFEADDKADQPLVRIEAGEYFAAWAGGEPRIFRFATPMEGEADKEPDTGPTEDSPNHASSGATGSIHARRQQPEELSGPEPQADHPQPSRSTDAEDNPKVPKLTPTPEL